VQRCAWAKSDVAIRHHDDEWGVPLHDDRRLFEFLILEGAQAGLSWDTILRKRDNYRKAFDDFDHVKIARYSEKRVAKLLANPGIIRNRLKVAAAIGNAKAFLAVRNRWRVHQQVPARTAESDRMSKDLAKRGFKFVGSTICYAFMQSVGMVNDHAVECFRYSQIS
jgi:DNA-3-methyladenine glycosylase I